MTLPYERQNGENLVDWKIRLFDNKELYNLNSQQIADIINENTGQAFGESSYRKWYRVFDESRSHLSSKNLSNSEIIDELEAKKIEIKKETVKLRSIANEHNKIVREDAHRDRFFEDLSNEFKKHILQPPPKFNVIIKNNSNRVPVLGFGDIHFGKLVDSVNNTYNEDILNERMSELLSETVHYCEKENLNQIHVLNGADSIEGMTLRMSQMQSLQMGMVQMTIRFQRLMTHWLSELSKYIDITYHHIPSSNHSEIRPLGTKAGQFPSEDMEKIIVTYIHDMLMNHNNITVPLYKGDYAKFKIFDYLVYAKHGHQIKNIKTAIRDLSMIHREFIDYLFLAHYHHGEEITVGEASTNNVQVILLPSVMGSDKYSDKLMTGAKAGAKICVFEEGKGKVDTREIILN